MADSAFQYRQVFIAQFEQGQSWLRNVPRERSGDQGQPGHVPCLAAQRRSDVRPRRRAAADGERAVASPAGAAGLVGEGRRRCLRDRRALAAAWSPAVVAWVLEKFNGFGYRVCHHVRSPYVWGATSVQQRGKYTADRRWDPSLMDPQIAGMALLAADDARAGDPHAVEQRPRHGAPDAARRVRPPQNGLV